MCDSCDEIIQVGNSGTNGWSPIYANIETTCDGNDVVIQQLVSWTGGTGNRPSYDGNVMTDAWLTANPIYLGETGWVDVICDATNILGTNGTNGSNGSNGATGEAGNDGCNPDITINVTAGSEEIVCTVTPSGPDCAPVFDINIPNGAFTNETVIDTITNSTEFTTAVTNAVNAALNVTPTTDSSIDISTGNSSNIKYTAVSGSPTISIFNPSDNYISHYIVGNLMTINFKLRIGSDATGAIRLEMKIPASETSAGTIYSNSISCSASGYSSVDDYLTPTISTQSTTGNTHLVLGLNVDGSGIVNPIPVTNNSFLFTLTGQITFLIN